jgi:branched-chain amino acid transport system ATP-binding protein
MLEIHDLSKRFGGLAAVNAVSTTVEAGKINAIIGPNGAGKTTFFNLISGVHKPSAGRIVLQGQDVTGWRPDQMARLGIARTFQTTTLFDLASVEDNLIVGHRLRTQSGLLDVLLGSARLKREEAVCREKARAALDFVGLSRIAHRMAGDISQEERKRVAFALALATEPRIVLLDEPAGGVNPGMIEHIAGLLLELNRQGITFLIVEHNMPMVLELCDPILVMARGRVIAEVPPAAVQRDPAVLDAYLGEGWGTASRADPSAPVEA